jgi:hypothetical protein
VGGDKETLSHSQATVDTNDQFETQGGEREEGIARRYLGEQGGRVSHTDKLGCRKLLTALGSNVGAQKRMIENRIDCLKRALESSQFDPERDNIRCAIAAYKSGEIKYSSRYTLIWAGKIVDTVDEYADFVTDRATRLNQYAADHGPHWLWYERGLQVHPDGALRLSICSTLSRRVTQHGLGQYYVKQSYQKRAGWVMRMPENDPKILQGLAYIPEHIDQDFLKSADGRIYCQQEGPSIVYQSLLDSGASMPSLTRYDFQELGVDPQIYSAQTVETLNTANGQMESRCYELFVCVLDDDCRHLVDPQNAVWPWHGKFLGGLSPVVVCGEMEAAIPDGIVFNQRLSGMLPFLACYLSSTPTRNKIFLGEDRNDVLGTHKIPGQRRWNMGMPSTGPISAPNWEKFGNPKIRFSHRNGQIIDEDAVAKIGSSFLTINKGTPQEMTVESDPSRQCEASRLATLVQAATAQQNHPQYQGGPGQGAAGPSQ